MYDVEPDVGVQFLGKSTQSTLPDGIGEKHTLLVGEEAVRSAGDIEVKHV
jgi:hypothetical protein